MENHLSRLDFLAEVASMYYDQNLTQQEIAARVGLTRSAISRLLTEAREKRIVEIRVHHPYRVDDILSTQLCRTFGLKAARVLKRTHQPGENVLHSIGILAAQYFSAILGEDDTVGVSWGRGLREMIAALRAIQAPRVKVVQLVGSMGSEQSSAVGPLLAPLLANTLGCACHYLHAPLITQSVAVHEVLCQDPALQASLRLARSCTLALVGVGTTRPESYNPYKLGYVSAAEVDEIKGWGAIGVVCGRHYNLRGEVLDLAIHRRVIGIDLDDLMRVPTVVGVAGQSEKIEAILGALRGGFINVLITDDSAARGVLALHARQKN